MGTDSLPLDGTTLVYDVEGNGGALLLIHGGLGDRTMWEDQVPAFSERYQTIVPDLRGFGASSLPADPFAWTDDLRALLTHLGVDRAHVVGLSLGGSIALDFAETYPEMVRSLVLVGSGLPGFEWAEEEAARMNQADEIGESGDIARAVELELQLWIDGRRPPGQMDPAVRERVRVMNERAWRTPHEGGEPGMVQENPRERLADIAVPTLVVVGGDDVRGIHDIAGILVSSIPEARLAVIPDAAHHPQMERPQDFNRLVLDFLATVQ